MTGATYWVISCSQSSSELSFPRNQTPRTRGNWVLRKIGPPKPGDNTLTHKLRNIDTGKTIATKWTCFLEELPNLKNASNLKKVQPKKVQNKNVQELLNNCSIVFNILFSRVFKNCSRIGIAQENSMHTYGVSYCSRTVQELFKNCSRSVQELFKSVQKLIKRMSMHICRVSCCSKCFKVCSGIVQGPWRAVFIHIYTVSCCLRVCSRANSRIQQGLFKDWHGFDQEQNCTWQVF